MNERKKKMTDGSKLSHTTVICTEDGGHGLAELHSNLTAMSTMTEIRPGDNYELWLKPVVCVAFETDISN